MLLEHLVLSSILSFWCILLTYFIRNIKSAGRNILMFVECARQCPLHPLLWGPCPSLSHGSRNYLICCLRSKPELKSLLREIHRGQRKDKHSPLLSWKGKREPHSCGKVPNTTLLQEETPHGYQSLNLGMTHPYFNFVGNSMGSWCVSTEQQWQPKESQPPYYHCLVQSCSHVIRWSHRYRVAWIIPSSSSQSVQGFISLHGVHSLHR